MILEEPDFSDKLFDIPFCPGEFIQFLRDNFEAEEFEQDFREKIFNAKKFIEFHGNFEYLNQTGLWNTVQESYYPSESEFSLRDHCGNLISLLDFFRKYLMDDYFRRSLKRGKKNTSNEPNLVFSNDNFETVFPNNAKIIILDKILKKCKLAFHATNEFNFAENRKNNPKKTEFDHGKFSVPILPKETDFSGTQLESESLKFEELNLLEIIKCKNPKLHIVLEPMEFKQFSAVDAHVFTHFYNQCFSEITVYVFDSESNKSRSQLFFRELKLLTSADLIYPWLNYYQIPVYTFIFSGKSHFSSIGNLNFIFRAKSKAEISLIKTPNFEETVLSECLDNRTVTDFQGNKIFLDLENIRHSINEYELSKINLAKMEKVIQTRYESQLQYLISKVEKLKIFLIFKENYDWICSECHLPPFSIAFEKENELICLDCSQLKKTKEFGIILTKDLHSFIIAAGKWKSQIQKNYNFEMNNLIQLLSNMCLNAKENARLSSKTFSEDLNVNHYIAHLGQIKNSIIGERGFKLTIQDGCCVKFHFADSDFQSLSFEYDECIAEYINSHSLVEHSGSNTDHRLEECLRTSHDLILAIMMTLKNKILNYDLDSRHSFIIDSITDQVEREKTKMKDIYESICKNLATPFDCSKVIIIKSGFHLCNIFLRQLVELGKRNFEAGELAIVFIDELDITLEFRESVTKTDNFLNG